MKAHTAWKEAALNLAFDHLSFPGAGKQRENDGGPSSLFGRTSDSVPIFF